MPSFPLRRIALFALASLPFSAWSAIVLTASSPVGPDSDNDPFTDQNGRISGTYNDTLSSFDLNGGNMVAIVYTSENGSGLSATYGGEALDVVSATGANGFVSVAYLINPSLSVADLDISATWTGSGGRMSLDYSVYALSGVAGLADTASRTNNGTLNYDINSVEGGYVFVLSENNNFSGPATTVADSNIDVFDANGPFDGNHSVVHAHGDVASATTWGTTFSGANSRVNLVVAFDALGPTYVPEPGTTGLLAFGALIARLCIRRRNEPEYT